MTPVTGTIVPGREIAWAAGQHVDREALVFGERRYSFRQVDARANRLANALRGLGHRTGDRVGVLLHNGIEAVDCVFGLLKGGFASVPLNYRHTAAEQLDVLLDAGCSAIVADAEFEALVSEVAPSVPTLRTVVGAGWRPRDGHAWDGLMEAASDREPGLAVRPDELMRLTYTSGTTGRPKGVVGTHRRHLARLANFFASLEYALGRDHTMLHVGPLAHVAGNYLLPCFMRGARGVIMRAFEPEAVQDAIERHRVDHTLLVPTMITRFVTALDPSAYDLSSLTRINYGTAPIPVEILRKGIAILGPVFRQHYGMSEANSPLTLLYPDEHVVDGPEAVVARLASCGRPVSGVEIELRGDAGEAVPAGEVGEIVIRSEGAADVEYWQRPDLTRDAVREGWFHTGDLGRFDGDGYLFIVGRKKDMIITGGYNVYAREVEDALYRHPAILEAAVLGVQDPEWGEVVAATIVPKPGKRMTPADVDAHCRRLVAGYKCPRVVLFADALPKTASGKIAKERLRPALEAEHAAGPGGTTGVMARY